jgi:hypothetical protein
MNAQDALSLEGVRGIRRHNAALRHRDVRSAWEVRSCTMTPCEGAQSPFAARTETFHVYPEPQAGGDAVARLVRWRSSAWSVSIRFCLRFGYP